MPRKKSKFKITCVADLHMYFPNDLPGGDILLIAGDVSYKGTISEISQFNEWVKNQHYRYKVLIAGNHDWLFEKSPSMAKALIDGVTHYLNDELIEIEGIKIYGSPITPWFCNWAFNRWPDEIHKHWDLIPNCDILMTHGPPHGILDNLNIKLMKNDPYHGGIIKPNHAGCPTLLKKVKQVKPKIHLFGHLHECYGQEKIDGIHFINASIMNEHYRPTNKPINLTFVRS